MPKIISGELTSNIIYLNRGLRGFFVVSKSDEILDKAKLAVYRKEILYLRESELTTEYILHEFIVGEGDIEQEANIHFETNLCVENFSGSVDNKYYGISYFTILKFLFLDGSEYHSQRIPIILRGHDK